MRRRIVLFPIIAVVWFTAAVLYADYVPDLPASKASELISRAPEFNRYARLVRVEAVEHAKGSMKGTSFALFSFRYLNAAAAAPAISARATFGYWRGAWHLSDFDYGCPGTDCHSVDVYKEPVDNSNGLLEFLRFLFFRPM